MALLSSKEEKETAFKIYFDMNLPIKIAFEQEILFKLRVQNSQVFTVLSVGFGEGSQKSCMIQV